MATLSYDIPDADLERCIIAFCAVYGYQPVNPDGTPNAEPPQLFARRMMSQLVIAAVTGFEGRAFVATAATNPIPPISIT